MLKIWLLLYQGDHSLYIRAKMTSFVDSHDWHYVFACLIKKMNHSPSKLWHFTWSILVPGTYQADFAPPPPHLYPLDEVSTLQNMANCCMSVKRDIVMDWVGEHVDNIYWNYWAMMKFLNVTGFVNFVCTIFEQGNKEIALSSMENPIVQWYLPLGAFPRANFSYDLFFT